VKSISDLARHWSRKSEAGKGLRIEAGDLDQLNAIGMGELLQAAAAEEQRKICERRINPSTRGENTSLSTISELMGASGLPTFRSAGTTTLPDVSEAAARAQRALRMPNGR